MLILLNCLRNTLPYFDTLAAGQYLIEWDSIVIRIRRTIIVAFVVMRIGRINEE